MYMLQSELVTQCYANMFCIPQVSFVYMLCQYTEHVDLVIHHEMYLW